MTLPVFYTFRRCPYAMRARLGVFAAGLAFEWREVVLRDKPAAMLEASPKGTVPVLVLPDGRVLEESRDILFWALRENDPEGWLEGVDSALIDENDGAFKYALDRYKYPPRYPDCDPHEMREKGAGFIRELDRRLAATGYLAGTHFGATDAAILPFVRQFAHVDRDWFWQEDWSNVITWLDGFIASDRFRAIMHKQAPWSSEQYVTYPEILAA